MNTVSQRPIALWLFVCCALVFAMVVLGGTTRLTRSGLSIVAWEPIVGTIPPLTVEQWDDAFESYQRTPEYRHVNVGMPLSDFKSIYWVEYAHRLLGRIIGLAFLIPLIYFLIKRRIDHRTAPKLIALFVLGGLQGALGWFMVASGLIDEPRVSPYRLTAHLALAAIIYGYMLWVALDLLYTRDTQTVPRTLRRMGWTVTGLVFAMILAGGFVAGTRAGFAFNTFPLMNGRFVPEGIFAMQPLWVNFFENVATVQFNHRLLAYVLCIVIPVYWFATLRVELSAATRLGLHGLLILLAAQVALGIATLVYAVPTPLGAAHQGGALLVFTAAVFLNHRLRPRQAHAQARASAG